MTKELVASIHLLQDLQRSQAATLGKSANAEAASSNRFTRQEPAIDHIASEVNGPEPVRL